MVSPSCQGIFTQEALELLREVLQWFYTLAPILLIVLAAVDYGKAVMSQDDEEIKKVTSKVSKRILATFLVFLVPFFVSFLLGMDAVQQNLGDIKLLDDPSCAGSERYIVSIRKEVQSGTNEVSMILTPSFEYAEVKLPDGTMVKNGEPITYLATTNGTYIYTFYDEKGEEITQVRYLVGTIDTKGPEGSCTYKAKEGIIQVSAKDESGILSYSYFNGKNYSASMANHSYYVGKKVESPKVKVKDKMGNLTEMICEIIEPDLGTLEVHMIKVGDGDAMVIRSKSQVLMVDSGYERTASRVVTYLKDLGISKIDVYIATHFHDDHIGGIPTVFKNFTVGKVYSPVTKITNSSDWLDPIRSRTTGVKVGQVINFNDEFSIKIVGPINLRNSCVKGKDCANKDSVNFILTFGETKFYFSADYVQSSNVINRFGTAELSNIDFLKQPHHGLHDVISLQLLKIMKPSIIFVPDGRTHLSSNMKKWHKSIGATVYHTYKNGNLLAVSDGEKLTVHTNVTAKNYKR